MPTVNQSSNKISRRLGVLERQLKPKLVAFYNKHIKGSNAPIQTIRQRYGEEIERLVRNNVQTSWLFANDIMAERTDTTINLTVSDVEGIERTTEDMTNQFWTTSQKNLQRETEFKVKDNHLEPKPEFELGAAMLGIASLILYLSFNKSILSKSLELDLSLKLKFVVRDDCIDKKICLPLNGKIYDVGEFPFTLPLHRHCHCKLIPILA